MKKTKKKKKKFLTEIYESNTPALTKIEKVFQYKMIEWIKSLLCLTSFNCMHAMLEWFSFVSCFSRGNKK